MPLALRLASLGFVQRTVVPCTMMRMMLTDQPLD
jgi:hypothetical protein